MEEFRLKGNDKFKAGDYAGAVEEYEKGLLASSEIKSATPENSQSSTMKNERDEKVKLLGNISTCQRKLNQPEKAIAAASRAVDLDRLALKPRILRSVVTAETGTGTGTGTCSAGSLCTALRDAAMSCLIDATARTQVEGPVLHWAGRQLLNASQQHQPQNGSNDGSCFTKVAKTRDNDLGLFATQDLPQIHTIIAGGGDKGKIPFSIGLYAESFTPSATKITTTTKAATENHPEINNNNNHNNNDDDTQDQEDDPVVHNKDAGKVCLSCGRCSSASSPLDIFPCTECFGVAAYCSDCTNSKKPGVARHAKYECARIQKLAAVYKIAEQEEREGSDELLEIGFHVITTLAAMHYQAESVEGGDYRGSSILALKGNSDVLLPHANVMDVLHSALEDDSFADAAMIDRVAAICLCNSFQVADDSGLPTCQVLFDSVLSRVNHSCMPNCEFDAAQRCVRTIRPIKAGEELCISYIANLYYPTDLRREQIQARFCFKCECERCAASSSSSAAGTDNLDWLVQAARPGINAADAVSNSAKVVQNVVEFARQREPDEVAPELLHDLEQVKAKLGLELHGTHYLMQDLRNAITFCASALDKRELVKQSCFDEWMMWETLFPMIALPVKRDKIKNILLASEGDESASTEWLVNWLAVYDPTARK